MFSRSILEPILNIIVALFLYKIRSDSVLHSISIGLLPSSYIAEKTVRLSQENSKSKENKSRKIVKGLADPKEKSEGVGYFQTPNSIKDFNDSVEYFQLCLSNLDPRFRLMEGNKIRFHDNWQNLREKFPDNMITKKIIENGFSPSSLAEMGMDLTSLEKEKSNSDIVVNKGSKLKDDNYLNHDANIKRIEVEVVLNQSGNVNINESSRDNHQKKNSKYKSGDDERFNAINDTEIDRSKGARSNSNCSGFQGENLGGVMDLSITQILKMSSVINNQWLKMNS